MGVSCLGRQRHNVSIYRSELPPKPQLQNKTQAIKASTEQGNPVKISKRMFTCSVCQQFYNKVDKQPMIVCLNNHTYCAKCIENMAHYNKRKCPECRLDFRELIRNRDIYQLIEDNLPVIVEAKYETLVDEDKQKLMRITINEDNRFLHNYSVEGQRVMKIKDDRIWQGLLFNEVIPQKGQRTFVIAVLYSQFNNIQIGIASQECYVQKNVTSKKAVAYHLNDGSIIDDLEGHPNGSANKWRKGGKVINLNTPITVKVNVNMDLSKISWWNGTQLLAEGHVSTYLKYHKSVPYILMCHVDDVIQLNYF